MLGEVACQDDGKTDFVLSEVEKMLGKMTVGRTSKQRSNQAPASSSAPVPLVGNPPVAKDKSSKRKQPFTFGMPTTSAHRKAGREHAKEKAAQEMAAQKVFLGQLA